MVNLERFSLAKRIGLGFAFVIGVIVAFAMSVSVVNWRLDSAVDEFVESSEQTLVLNTYLEDLLEARLAAIIYRTDDSAENAAEVMSNLAEITESTDGRTAFVNDPDLLDDVLAMQDAAAQYADVFQQTVALQQQRHAEVDVMSERGTQSRRTLSAVHEAVATNGFGGAAIAAAGSALEELLLARIYAERFLLTNDTEALARSKQHLADLGRDGRALSVALIQREDLRGQLDAALSDMAEFEAALDRVSAIILERNRLRGEVMDEIGAGVTERIAFVNEGVMSQYADANASAQALLSRTAVLLPIITVLCLIAAIAIAYLIGRSTTAAIRLLSGSTRKLADGNVDLEIRGTEYEHELGDMARSLLVFRNNEIERRSTQAAAEENHAQQENVVAEVSSRLESLANGDLTVRIDGAFPEEFADLKLNFNRTMEQLEATISQVVETANWLNENVALVGDATTQLSRRNENQAAAIEETSAASSALSNSVQETSAHAMKARTFAGNTRQSAANGAKTVEDTTRAMDRIQASSEKISAIIGLIEDVAFQTNLLALNAGVEAARAGDAGRGFAVVASEVGALSRRSAEAVSEIREIISQALEDVSAGVETVGQAGVSIREIGDMVDQISTLIEDISDATTEQSDSLSSTNASVKQIDAMTQENAAMSEETAATAQSLADGARSLLEVTGRFKTNAEATRIADRMVA
jgi:methyl-accepting chemotaxis protein